MMVEWRENSGKEVRRRKGVEKPERKEHAQSMQREKETEER